jgi:cellular nucleic acid-binding protein
MDRLYILKCENDKYYIGKTKNVAERYKQHIAGEGSAWTSKYKPLKLMEARELRGEHDETNTTKDYMKKYGIENVRGGSYTQINLDSSTMNVLRHEILGNTNACYTCGEKGHFANKCEFENVWQCEFCPREFKTSIACEKHEDNCPGQVGSACYRCGRASHYAFECYARTSVNGCPLI